MRLKLLAIAAALATAPMGHAAVTPGGVTSAGVEWLGSLPFVVNGVGGRLVDGYFYASDQHKIMIFDVSNPELPILTGATPFPQEVLFSREDIDTNGRVLVYNSDITGRLSVYDVTNKNLPTLIGTVSGVSDHTVSCVADCTWVYGSDGTIVDLRTPTAPRRISTNWASLFGVRSSHDVEEIAPGRVLTATQPMLLLDVTNPSSPTVLASGANFDRRFIHSVRWPNEGRERFALASGETNFQPRCHGSTGAFMTWDTDGWERTGEMTMVSQFRVFNGTYLDGSPAVNQVGCSSHWFEAHPGYDGGGVVAAAFFEHGVRFLDVSSQGNITEIGHFMPWGGATGAVYWITDEIAYTVDYNRGIDILRFSREIDKAS